MDKTTRLTLIVIAVIVALGIALGMFFPRAVGDTGNNRGLTPQQAFKETQSFIRYPDPQTKCVYSYNMDMVRMFVNCFPVIK